MEPALPPGGHIAAIDYRRRGPSGPATLAPLRGATNTLSEIIALAAMVISIGTNVGLFIHLGSTMNTRFDSVERRLVLLTASLHGIDIRLTKWER